MNFGYRQNLCLRGLCHDFPSKIFVLTVPKHFVEEPFCAVFQKISGSEKWIRARGKYQDFPSKSFCLTVPKKLVGEPFSVSFISGICRILKSSLNNRQRRIESLRSFSALFSHCSTTTPLNTCTRSKRRGIGGASTKIYNSE